MEVKGLREKICHRLSSDCSLPFRRAVCVQASPNLIFFRDVIPTDPEDNFPHQVVRIAYSPEFKDCFDYFRAISEKGELSQRIGLI